MLQDTALVEVTNLEGFREILAEIVRSAGLEGLAVAHHGFDRKGLIRSGETLGIGLAARDDGDGGFVHCKVGVDVQHLARFGFRFGQRGVRGVALLPEKFERAEEKLGAKFPADHAIPLIDQHRQVAIGLNPLRVGVADDGLGSGADNQRLFQLFAAAVRYDRELGRESRYVGFFLVYEAARNQQRECGVHVARGLEAAVQRGGDVLPERPAVGTDDHAAAHGSVVRQFCPQYELVIPFGKIFGASWQLLVRHAWVGSFLRRFACGTRTNARALAR